MNHAHHRPPVEQYLDVFGRRSSNRGRSRTWLWEDLLRLTAGLPIGQGTPTLACGEKVKALEGVRKRLSRLFESAIMVRNDHEPGLAGMFASEAVARRAL
jgi:hypothetical protein